jgi:DNA-3-methyladenine glycosylase II
MDYVAHLSKDKKLAAIILEPLEQLHARQNIPLRLMASIMSQQLSTKVAKVIYHRFLTLFNGEEPAPQQVLATPAATLRAIGLSNAKVSYVHNVARFCIEQNIEDHSLQSMSNEDIIALLTQIKGVGRWTVEMLLMFTLGREDIFAPDDLGIQQAMIKLYNIKATDRKALKEKMLKLSAKWKPYRTYACMHLWRWKDNVPDA